MINWKKINILLWSLFAMYAIVFFYANHFYPHGSYIYTGELICRNDGRGPCDESYIEDTRKLNVPTWVKEIRTAKGELLIYTLIIFGVYTSVKSKEFTSSLEARKY